MTDGLGRSGNGPPTAVAPAKSARRPSRHDQFPHADRARRRRLHRAEVALAEQLRAIDEADGGIVAALRALDSAEPEHVFAALLPWLHNENWIARRLAALTRLARADDFAMPPIRIFSGAALAGLILAEAGPITLSLMVRPFNAPTPRAPTVIFSPGHGLTRIVKAGGARLQRYAVAVSDAELAGGFRAATAAPCISKGEWPLADGALIRIDQSRESFNLVSASDGSTGDIVMVQAFVRAPSRLPMREYDPVSGRLVRVAASDRATSFRQMGLTMLRAFGRRDAAELFTAALNDTDFAMRWQVMRELTALDPGAALPHLLAMAAHDPHPEVRAAATATLPLVSEHLARHAAPRAARQKEAAQCH